MKTGLYANNFDFFLQDKQLGKVLIIRSFSPLIKDVINSIFTVNPRCIIDILQTSGATSVQDIDVSRLNKIWQAKSPNGFLIRNLLNHWLQFSGVNYDAVIVLYGINYKCPRYYNADLYACCVKAVYKIGVNIKGGVSTVNFKSIIRGFADYLFGWAVYCLNIIATFFIFVYAMILLILFSPLSLFYKRK